MTKLNQSIALADGRRLGYDEYGPADGKPLFYFHGTPSSRKGWRALGNEAVPEKLGVRVIAADRPGMGLSGFQPGRRIGDWSADVAALADALEIELCWLPVLATHFIRVQLGIKRAVLHSQTTARRTPLGSVNSHAEQDHAIRHEAVVTSGHCREPTIPPHHGARAIQHRDGYAS